LCMFSQRATMQKCRSNTCPGLIKMASAHVISGPATCLNTLKSGGMTRGLSSLGPKRHQAMAWSASRDAVVLDCTTRCRRRPLNTRSKHRWKLVAPTAALAEVPSELSHGRQSREAAHTPHARHTSSRHVAVVLVGLVLPIHGECGPEALGQEPLDLEHVVVQVVDDLKTD